jgi:hypothetical protein
MNPLRRLSDASPHTSVTASERILESWSVSATAFRLSGNVRDERVIDLVDDETRVVSVSHVRSSLEKPLRTEGWSARSGGVKHSCFIKICRDQEIFLPPD